MKTDELNHNIDELKYAYSFWSPEILTVHKGLFEDELEDSIHNRKAEVKRQKKKPPTTLGLYNLVTADTEENGPNNLINPSAI